MKTIMSQQTQYASLKCGENELQLHQIENRKIPIKRKGKFIYTF
jgi:hypothetical protein